MTSARQISLQDNSAAANCTAACAHVMEPIGGAGLLFFSSALGDAEKWETKAGARDFVLSRATSTAGMSPPASQHPPGQRAGTCSYTTSVL